MQTRLPRDGAPLTETFFSKMIRLWVEHHARMLDLKMRMF